LLVSLFDLLLKRSRLYCFGMCLTWYLWHMIYDDNTYTDTVDTTFVCCHSRLAVCTCCACFAKNMMMMYSQVPRIWYVRVHPIFVSLNKRHVMSVLLNIRWWCVSICPDSGTIPTHCTGGLGLCLFFKCAGLRSAAKTVVSWLGQRRIARRASHAQFWWVMQGAN